MRIKGYAAVFNSRSEDLGGFVEIVAPGAFDASLRSGRNVVARAEHDSRLLLGTTTSGTLRLTADARGLWYEVDAPDTTAGRDVAALVERGLVTQSSFAFLVEDRASEDWTTTEAGVPLRILKRVVLVDVAPVALPAYAATSVTARDTDQTIAEVMAARHGRREDLEMERIRMEVCMRSAEGVEQGLSRRVNMGAMPRVVELAALATNGERVDHSATLERGLRRLAEQRDADIAADRRLLERLR